VRRRRTRSEGGVLREEVLEKTRRRSREEKKKRGGDGSWNVRALMSMADVQGVQRVDDNNGVDDQRSKWQQHREGRPMGPTV
jgi:hypothetical protein